MFLKNLDNLTFEAKCHTIKNKIFGKCEALSCDHTCHIKEGEQFYIDPTRATPLFMCMSSDLK